jgi:nucleoid-associated protein YgaU
MANTVSNGKLEKATLINLDRPSDRVECLFNPKEYTFSRQNSWKFQNNKGANLPTPEFQSGQPATLQISLFFDTFESKKDVREAYTEKIWNMMRVIDDPKVKDQKTKKGRPPIVQFQWGKAWSFEAVITSIQQKFMLFLSDGTPVRAELTLSLQQVKDVAAFGRQNPTSGGMPGQRVRTVREGETIDRIAYEEYGDATRWRAIAEANNLSDPMRLRAGSTLAIPPL